MEVLKQVIKEHIEFRKQLFSLAIIEYKKEESDSLLGALWNIIKPMILIAVYWFTFAIGLRANSDVGGQSFFMWLIAGIIPWFYLSEMMLAGSRCLSSHKYLINKMKFPFTIIHTFVNISRLITHLVLCSLLIFVYYISNGNFTIYILQLPIYIFLAFLFINLWSFFSSHLVVFSKDLFNIIKSTITPFFWLSGIIWNVDNISIPWLKIFLKFNPFTYLVNGYRNCFINEQWFYEDIGSNCIFMFILIVLLFCGIITYKKLRKEIPDVL